MRIQTTLLAISLAGAAPLAPAADPPAQEEPAPVVLPVTEEQTRALEALRKKQAELDAQQPPPPAAPAKPAKIKEAPEAQPKPAPAPKKSKPAKPEPPPPPEPDLNPFAAVPTIPPDADAQNKALEAVRQKQAELDAGTPQVVETPRVEPKVSAPVRMPEPMPAPVVSAPATPAPPAPRGPYETRTVVVQPSTRTIVVQPSTRTVVVPPGSRANSLPSPGASISVPTPDSAAQAQAVDAVRRRQAELNGQPSGAASVSGGASAADQMRAMEAVRQRQTELNAENQRAWANKEAEAAANRAQAEAAAQRARGEVSTTPVVSSPPVVIRTPTPPPYTPPPQPVVSSTVAVQAAPVIPADSDAQAKALAALRQKEAELNAQNPREPSTARTSVQPVQPTPSGTVRAAEPVRVTTPPPSNPIDKPLRAGGTVGDNPAVGSVATTKDEKLAELLRKYRADLITPREYHEERAKIIAEP